MILAKSEIEALHEWMTEHMTIRHPEGMEMFVTISQSSTSGIGTNSFAKCAACKENRDITNYGLW